MFFRFFVLLAFALCALDAKPIELTFWTPFTGGDGRPMQNIINKFNASQDSISVEMKIVEWSEYYKVLQDSIQNKQSPDIAIVHASKLIDFIDSGSLLDVDTLAKYQKIDWNDFEPHLLDAITEKGKHYAIPLDTHPLIMYYNKKYLANAELLDDNGLPIIQKGVKGFLEFFEKLQKSLPPHITAFGSASDNVYPFWIWYAFYSQLEGGGRYIENNKAVFDNPLALEALKVVQQMRKEGIWSGEIHDVKSYNMFKYGHSAVLFSGVWATWSFEENKELDFGSVAIPTLFDKPATWGDSHLMIIPRQGNKEKMAAALKFADWVSANSIEWAVSGQIPAKMSVTQSQAFQSMKHRKDYLQSASLIKHYPKNPKLWECNKIMEKVFAEMMEGKLTPEETLAKARIGVDRILDAK